MCCQGTRHNTVLELGELCCVLVQDGIALVCLSQPVQQGP